MFIDTQPEENTGQINLDDFLDQRRTRPQRPIGAAAQSSDPERDGADEPRKDQR
jgi:hypothetical protein